MAEEQPSLHIDTDWKRQAQEEKRRLAEQEAQRRAAEQPAAPTPVPGAAPATAAGATSAPNRNEAPPVNITTLVQSLVTQILFYIGDLAPRGAQPTINLDMAKHNIDMLGVLEAKTKGNLSADEQRMLDGALYETRMRYVSVASQYATV